MSEAPAAAARYSIFFMLCLYHYAFCFADRFDNGLCFEEWLYYFYFADYNCLIFKTFTVTTKLVSDLYHRHSEGSRVE